MQPINTALNTYLHMELNKYNLSAGTFASHGIYLFTIKNIVIFLHTTINTCQLAGMHVYVCEYVCI